MKTILMIGDSWGVPNYYGLPGVAPEFHTELKLKELGYKVYNCSQNGSGNIQSLNKAKEFLQGIPVSDTRGIDNIVLDDKDIKIDFVVWFHTEFFRDEKPDPSLTLENNLKWMSKRHYKAFAEFFKELNAKVIVIGGQTPIRDELFKVITPYFFIQDWKSVILGKDLPKVYCLGLGPNASGGNAWIDELPDSTEDKLKALNDIELIYDAMRDSPDFPDQCHPGILPHKYLTETLHRLFNECV